MVKENFDAVEFPHVIIERMPLTEIENEDARRRGRKKKGVEVRDAEVQA